MTIPVFEGDFWSDEVLANPFPYYKQLRDAGPAVFLKRHDVWAMTRFTSVRDALRNTEVFSSAKGCMLNNEMNQAIQGAMLCTDDPYHRQLRQVFSRPVSPSALAPLKGHLSEISERHIDALIARGEFEAVTELSHFLPLTAVTELVGLSEEGKVNMLRWAAAIFDAFGPDTHRRTLTGIEITREAFTYAATLSRESLDPKGWGAMLFDAADRGEIEARTARGMLMDYLGPALDTTINATSSALKLFAKNPEQWALLRGRPELMATFIDEVVRLESPIRGFSRYVTRDHDVEGITLPQGSWALMLYACANRDERRYKDPERFDITRDARDHLGFGFGTHVCAGMHLAKLEITTLFEILCRKVKSFEVLSEEYSMNNTLRGLTRLDIRVHAG